MLIYLIGFMACGKTKTGKVLAKKLNYNFIDLDYKIEALYNKTISEIFATIGEKEFRLIEQNELHKTTIEKNTIVSCGGGAACFFNNINVMNHFGKCIYLKTDAKLLTKRLILTKAKRPLVANKTDIEIENLVTELLNTRSKFYDKANYIISNAFTQENNANEIINVMDLQ